MDRVHFQVIYIDLSLWPCMISPYSIYTHSSVLYLLLVLLQLDSLHLQAQKVERLYESLQIIHLLKLTNFSTPNYAD